MVFVYNVLLASGAAGDWATTPLIRKGLSRPPGGSSLGALARMMLAPSLFVLLLLGACMADVTCSSSSQMAGAQHQIRGLAEMTSVELDKTQLILHDTATLLSATVAKSLSDNGVTTNSNNASTGILPVQGIEVSRHWSHSHLSGRTRP